MSLDGDFRSHVRHDDDDEHGSHAEFEVRWLLPYADMITLLLALFIVLYAMSVVNNTKLDALSQSINKAFNGSKPTPGASSSPDRSEIPQNPGSKLLNSGVSLAQLQKAVQSAQERKTEDTRLRRLQQRIENYANQRHLQDKLNTVIDERGLVIRLVSDKVLFDNGQAKLLPGFVPLLTDIGRLLRTQDNHVRVEGHTDNVPIHTARFPSNWELSATRATSVVRLLERVGIADRRLSAVGYSSKRPLKPNVTRTGRARNRRVEVVVLRTATLLGADNDIGEPAADKPAAQRDGLRDEIREAISPNLGIDHDAGSSGGH